MNYKDFNDNELVAYAKENNEDAKNIIYEKYKYIIKILANKYKKSAYVLGIEENDLEQEAMIGFVGAIYTYNDSKSSLKTYISLCVERQIYTTLKKANTLKNKINNEALSLEYDYGEETKLVDILSDNNLNDPLDNIIINEKNNEFIDKIKDSLSDSEKMVFSLMLAGHNYKQIAQILDITPKQVDNARNRIRNKARKILEESEF